MNDTTYPRLRFPKPFDSDRLADLLAVASELTDLLRFPGGRSIPEADFWRAALLAHFDSGLPLARLFAIPWRAIPPDGLLTIECRLRRETLFAIGRIASTDRPLVFALPEHGYDAANRLRLIRMFAGELDSKGGGA